MSNRIDPIEGEEFTHHQLRMAAIDVSLRAVAEPMERWNPSGKVLLSRLLDEAAPAEAIEMLGDELPVFECKTDSTYCLVTTERILSRNSEGNWEQARIEELDRITCAGSVRENWHVSKVEFGCIERIEFARQDGSRISLWTEFPYGSYFASMLIYNLMSYRRYGRWYVDRKQELGDASN